MNQEQGLIFDFHGTLVRPRTRLRRFKLVQVWGFTPGVEDFLDQATALGISRTIATCGHFEHIRTGYEVLKLDRWFKLKDIVHADSGVALKPNPAHYLEATRRIGVPPEQCIAFEDSMIGIDAAKDAGIGRIIGINRPRQLLPSEMAGGVLKWIRDFSQLSVDEL